MEKVVRKVCLDSDILINLLNKDEETKKVIESIDAEFYTTTVNSFEIWYGRKDSEEIFQLLEWLNILELDQNSALKSADILRTLKKQGAMIDFRDLFIASICITNKIEFLTANKKHFERLKEFDLLLVKEK